MEIVHAHPRPGERVRDVTRVRSTVITSGIENLRASGLYERWARAVAPGIRDELTTAIAGTWIPIDVALEYYRGCDALGLTHEEGVAIGRRFAARTSDTLLHAVKRVAATVGVTPWTYATHFDRFWTRVMDGGGFRIVKVGPKDSSIEILGAPMAASPYFRAAFCGVHLAVLEVVTQAVTIRVTNVARTKDAFTVRTSWV
jgi:hypothetical protein